MSGRAKKKRGAPYGNQNARKHGFYSDVLTPEQEMDMSAATTVEGIDDEIALARTKIASIVRHDPNNINVLLLALNLLARLVRTRSQLPSSVRAASPHATETMGQFLNRLTGGAYPERRPGENK